MKQPATLPLLLALALLPACQSSSSPGGDDDRDGSVSAEDAVRDDDSVEPTCSSLIAQYREVLSSAHGRCETPDDCGVYDKIWANEACFGVTDWDSAKKLFDIEQEIVNLALWEGCDTGDSSAPIACERIRADCQDGLCVEKKVNCISLSTGWGVAGGVSDEVVEPTRGLRNCLAPRRSH